jgi:spore coat polysaccharide biosynthesis protein SpsF
MRVVAIVQARLGSERLPGKVLRDIAGEPMLVRVVNRTMRAKMLDEVVVATTIESRDDEIANLCELKCWICSRGREFDVLDRYCESAQAQHANVVVRITSDCPLIDPGIIDLTVRKFMEKGSMDYASNTLPPRTFPRGLDVEVMTFEALERAWGEDTNPIWREHVTPYIYSNPDLFKIIGVKNDNDLSHLRWTVDTPEDLAFVRLVYEHFDHGHFSWHEVISLLDKKPELIEINKLVLQKKSHE